MHNVIIGKNVRVIAGTVLCGSCKLNDGVYVAPGGIIRNQIKIGENSIVGMGSVVLDNIGPNKVVIGVPGRTIRDKANKNL